MSEIEKILLKLVSIQSDTGTVMECNIAKVIYDILGENEYFKSNSDYFGYYEENDILKRPVVWGLKKGNGNKTLILMGHYDAVEIESYGELKEYALNPIRLKEKMKTMIFSDKQIKEDLDNENWMFGRATADMKAGLAINIYSLFNTNPQNFNILFVAVPDEENMSSGAIQSIGLYKKLKEKFNLEYNLSIISEPQLRNPEEEKDIVLYGGTMGKILPIIMAKGILTHSAEIFKGLNSNFIISEIVHNIELTTELICEDKNTFTQPPTTQILKDLKTTYDVSTPEYSVMCANLLFLKNKTPNELIEIIRNLCSKSLDDVILRYNKSFDYMKEKGFHKEDDRKLFNGKVLTVYELEEIVRKTKLDYELFKENLMKSLKSDILKGNITLQLASINYMKKLLEIAKIDEPLVLIGIAPPYYPSVCNLFIDKDIEYISKNLNEYMSSKANIGVKNIPYFSGMDDMSYMSCTNATEEREFLNNMVLPTSIYDVPVEEISELNIPSYMIGPASKDVHKVGERVYRPDVIKHVPMIFDKIIQNMDI